MGAVRDTCRGAARERGSVMACSIVTSCALALVGCIPVERVVVDVPEGVEHVALVELDADGRVVRGTPVTPWTPRSALPLITSSSRALVVGWSAALAPPASESPVRAAERCEPALPAPVWAASWTADGFGAAPAELPALTAAWYFDRCPTAPPPILDAAWSCDEPRCVPQVARTGPCRVSIDLERCGAGSLEAFQAPDGALCFDPARATLPCARSAGHPEALVAMTCEAERTCSLELFDPTRAVAPFTIHSVALTNLPQVDFAVDSVAGVQPDMLNRGLAYDLAVAGDRAFVSAPGRGSGAPRCHGRIDLPSRLRVFDVESLEELEELATSTVGACLGALGRDLHGAGVLGVFHDLADSEWKLARFDRDAELVEAVTIPRLSPSLAPPGFTIDRLLPLEARGEVALLFRPVADALATSIVTIHDARTLAEKWRTELGSQHVGAGLRLDGDDVLLTLVPELRLLQTIDLVGRRLASERIGIDDGRENTAHDLLVLGPDADRVIVAQGARKLLHLTREGLRTTSTPLSTDADLTRVERWPASPSLLLVAGTIRSVGRLRRAELALYDPAAKRFLPGAWPVGGGLVSRIVADDAGRAFLLLPWSGTLVRLDPVEVP
jgi:hypothetical protein